MPSTKTASTADGAGRIHKLSKTGTVARVVANAARGNSGDGAPALDATFQTINGMAVDLDRSLLYVGDSDAQRIRTIDLSTGFIRISPESLLATSVATQISWTFGRRWRSCSLAPLSPGPSESFPNPTAP
ncbi:MAG: hypothetical protein R2762_11765 [Bryobacteraceae bacterium]